MPNPKLAMKKCQFPGCRDAAVGKRPCCAWHELVLSDDPGDHLRPHAVHVPRSEDEGEAWRDLAVRALEDGPAATD